jgi:hypothetical protein
VIFAILFFGGFLCMIPFAWIGFKEWRQKPPCSWCGARYGHWSDCRQKMYP